MIKSLKKNHTIKKMKINKRKRLARNNIKVKLKELYSFNYEDGI